MCHKILCFSYVECQIACLCGAKRLYFYRIAVALRMECVDLSDTKDGGKMCLNFCRTSYGVRGFKCFCFLICRKWKNRRTPHGVRGFKLVIYVSISQHI